MTSAEFVAEWLAGWNAHELDRIMRHYAEDAVFESPSVLVLHPESDGRVRGRAAIAALYAAALARFPALRFELEETIERPYGVIAIYRKWGVFSDAPGVTVETFHLAGGVVRRNVVYWGVDEVAARFRRA